MAPQFTSSINLDGLLYFPKLHFPHLHNRNERVVVRIGETMHVVLSGWNIVNVQNTFVTIITGGSIVISHDFSAKCLTLPCCAFMVIV